MPTVLFIMPTVFYYAYCFFIMPSYLLCLQFFYYAYCSLYLFFIMRTVFRTFHSLYADKRLIQFNAMH